MDLGKLQSKSKLFFKMDYIRDELRRIRSDINKLELKILSFEGSFNFQPNDIRYTRLVEEKTVLLQNFCELRINVSTFILNTSNITNCDFVGIRCGHIGMS